MSSINSSINQRITEILKKEYPEQFVSLKVIPYKGEISLFTFQFATEADLAQVWDKCSGQIAAYYQASLGDQFTKWNIYLLYVCREQVQISLKYKIENDRFSSRKIVNDCFTAALDDIALENITSNHITNADLQFSTAAPGMRSFSSAYNSQGLVWDLIKDATLKSGKGNLAATEFILDTLTEKLSK